MKTNDILLQSIRTLIQQEIEKAPFNKTKQGIITKNYMDGTYDVRFDGNLYTKILTYPNSTSLQLGQTVKIIIPNNQSSQMYISAEGSPLIYYPVGSYYETSDTTFNPNTAWGGTWVLETEGQVHVSAGANYAVSGALTDTTDGGNKDAIIPYHNHSTAITQPTFTIPNHTHKGYYRKDNATGGKSDRIGHAGNHDASDFVITPSSGGGGACKRTTNVAVTVDYAGSSGNTTDANMQPYIVVNRWHRTA